MSVQTSAQKKYANRAQSEESGCIPSYRSGSNLDIEPTPRPSDRNPISRSPAVSSEAERPQENYADVDARRRDNNQLHKEPQHAEHNQIQNQTQRRESQAQGYMPHKSMSWAGGDHPNKFSFRETGQNNRSVIVEREVQRQADFSLVMREMREMREVQQREIHERQLMQQNFTRMLEAVVTKVEGPLINNGSCQEAEVLTHNTYTQDQEHRPILGTGV